MAAAIGAATSALGGKGSRSRGSQGGEPRWKPLGVSEGDDYSGVQAEAFDKASKSQSAVEVVEADLGMSSTASSSNARPRDQKHSKNGGQRLGAPRIDENGVNGGSQHSRAARSPGVLTASRTDDEFPGLPTGNVSDLSKTTPCDEDVTPRSRSHILAQELQRFELRTEQRKNAIARMQVDLRKLQEETQDAVRHESRIIAESRREQAHALEQAELLQRRVQQHRQEVQQHLQEQGARAGGSDDAESHWLQELASMEHSQNTALEQCTEVDRVTARWHKACTEQTSRLRRAEAKAKSLEVRRKEQRAIGEKIRSQAVDSLEEGQRTRTEVQALRKQLTRVDLDVAKQRNQWQVACGVLLLMLLLLICGG